MFFCLYRMQGYKNNTPNFSALMKLSPNKTTYSDTKQVKITQENWNNALNLIKMLRIKAGYQQKKQQRVCKLLETEQLSTEWNMCQDRNKEIKHFQDSMKLRT